LAIAVSIALRLPFFPLPMISDEGGYAYVADRWLSDSGRLYHDLWLSRPQGILVVYGLLDRFFGPSVVAFRFVAWLASAVTLLMVWRYARDWAGRGTAILSAMIFALVASAPPLEGFTANAEVFMALPAAALAWRLLAGQRDGWTRRGLLVAGSLAGVSTLLKPSGFVMLPVAMVFIAWDGRVDGLEKARRLGLVVAGFMAALVPALIHGWFIGWDEFVFASVAYRVGQQSGITNGPNHHASHLAFLLRDSWWLWLAILVPFWGRSRGAPAPAEVRRQRRRLAARLHVYEADAGGRLLRLWLIGCLFGIAMGGDWWSHYLIQAAAPLSIAMAVLIRDAMAAFAPVRRLAVGAAFTLLLLVPYSVVALTEPAQRGQTIFQNASYVVEERVGRYINEHTKPNESIFVAFNAVAIYYFADRPSAYPYLFDQELRAFPNAQMELIALLYSEDRPEIVVATGNGAPFPDNGVAFWRILHLYYRVETTIGGSIIYRAIEVPPPVDRTLPRPS
jgi:4-amino-4-deoxy-L-arabinose transferase-like glycosyltransferase